MGAFSNKVVIITGASEGIGAAMALRFYEMGANLALLARRKEKLEEVCANMDSQRYILEAMDVRAYDQFDDLVKRSLNEWGSIDVLINNAGVHKRGSVDRVSEEDIALMVDVNLIAPLVLSKKMLPIFKKQGFGHIINIASLAGRVPVKDSATYSATKFGLRAFTYALAEEMKDLGPNIHCSAISPGPIYTGFIMSEINDVADIVFSQPISTVDQVVDLVVETAKDKKLERNSGGLKTKILTNLGYVFPGLRKALQPILIKKGKRIKKKLLAERAQKKVR